MSSEPLSEDRMMTIDRPRGARRHRKWAPTRAFCVLACGLLQVFVAPPAQAQGDGERITFDVRLSGSQGAGRVEGSAGDFEYQEDRYLLATGGVELRYGDIAVEAQTLRVDVPTNLLTAEGNVILDQGPQRLIGTTLEYDLETRTGRLTDATAFVDPEFFFSGAEIAKVGDLTYRVDDGVFTSCSQDVPSWSFALSDAEITLGGYAKIKNARFRLKRTPVIYWPYVIWPAKTDRASGFLIPSPGYSERRGASLGMAYYRTLGRSADTTFFADLSAEEYLGFGNEIRYRPSEDSEGLFEGYFLSEPDDIEDRFFNTTYDPARQKGDERWKLELHHRTKNLWGGWRGVVNFQHYSDLDYLQDFERDLDRQSRAFIYSDAYLSSNRGPHSFNILVDQRERLLNGARKDLRRQLPELEYRLRSYQLGSAPLYLDVRSSLSYLQIKRRTANDVTRPVDTREWGRADLLPSLSVPLSTLSWLSTKLEVGGRVTHYTGSIVDPTTRGFDDGEAITRTYPQAGLQVIGPSFSRIFESGGRRFSKLKHIVEPRFTYGYIDEFEERGQIESFDEIDSIQPLNRGKLSLINRLMAKPADESAGGAFEILSFELSQTYSFDDDLPGQVSQRQPELSTNEGPLRATLRFNPDADTSLKVDATYNTLFNRLRSFSFSGSSEFGPHTLGLSWFTRWRVEDGAALDPDGLPLNPAGDPTSDQLRLFTKLALVPKKLTLDAQVSYDLVEEELIQQRYFVRWNSACYGLQLEVRESMLNEIEDRDFRFAFNLKHVGSFIDVNGSF